MADVISVPANEGISVKNEQDDPEINALAHKLKENYEKNAVATAKQAVVNNAYINRAGKQVSMPITIVVPPIPKDDCEKPKDCEDLESIKGRFGYKTISLFNVPFIIRIINGEHLKFVSVRIAENQLLTKYLHYLHPDLYTCTSVRSHFITEAEARLLNEINQKHSDQMYGKEQFHAGKDYIVRLEDAQEFFGFLEVCYKKLLCNISPGRKDKCGFIRINSESVVPYCIKDDQKYVPLFYFEGETENLKHRAVKLENWDLAYLKFCCKVQGIRNELFASDSCIVTSLDDIKNYFPPDTNFEEYWPAKVVDTQLLTSQKPNQVNQPGAWTRAPPNATITKLAVSISENISHTLPVPTVVTPSSGLPMTNNAYQNGWPANQIVNSYSAQLPPTRGYSVASRNQNAAAQYYNSGSPILQQNTMINLNNSHILPPPLVRASNSTSINNNPPPAYPNMSAISQPLTTVYNPIITNSSNAISHSNRMRQFYSTQRSSSCGGQLHPQQQQQQQLQQQQQQQVISSPQVQQYVAQPLATIGNISGRVTNTQQRNALKNIPTASTSEIIDLSSPPSSPRPQTPPQDTTTQESNGWELEKIDDRDWNNDSPSNSAYKIQKTTLHGKTIHCINAKGYLYSSELLVTVNDLVQIFFPTSSVQKCVHVLKNVLRVTLFSGNAEQMIVLRENGRLRSLIPNQTPLVKFQDISNLYYQLKSYLVSPIDESSTEGTGPYQANKRQRTS